MATKTLVACCHAGALRLLPVHDDENAVNAIGGRGLYVLGAALGNAAQKRALSGNRVRTGWEVLDEEGPIRLDGYRLHTNLGALDGGREQ